MTKYYVGPGHEPRKHPVIELEKEICNFIRQAQEAHGDDFEVLVMADRQEGSLAIRVVDPIVDQMPIMEKPTRFLSTTRTSPMNKDEYPDVFENFKTTLGLRYSERGLIEASFSADLTKARASVRVRAIENEDGSLSIKKENEL